MNIKWIAHACFKLTLDSGKTILFDPFDESIGYKMEDEKTDYLFISHNHYDHNCRDHIIGEYQVFDTPGKFELEEGISAQGFETYHDDEQGAKRGKNICFKIEAEGLSILHMGDIGCVPDDRFFDEIGPVDILMIPVGGFYTVDAETAIEITKKIDPNIILPMHYKTLFLDMPLAPVFSFTDAAAGYYDRASMATCSFDISADNKKKRSRIMILENSLDM